MQSDDGVVDAALERLRQRDAHAFADLFMLHRARLRRMVDFRLDDRLRGRVDPSDVLQEAYLSAACRVDRYLEQPSVPFFVWLREITKQRLIDVHRQHLGARKRSVNLEVAWQPNTTSVSLAQQFAEYLASPSQVAQRIEVEAKLKEALDSMDAVDREVLALRHFEELTNDEAATVLGLKKAGASNRYVRALARLRRILEQTPGFFDDAESK